MSYCASVIVRDSGLTAEETAKRAGEIIESRFSGAEKISNVRVLKTPPQAVDDLGIVEIDVMQSRDLSALRLLESVFLALCHETSWDLELDWDGAEDLYEDFGVYMMRAKGMNAPVVFDPYADDGQAA